MRQIKSFMNLVLHLIKISNFDNAGTRRNSVKLNIIKYDIGMFNTNTDVIEIVYNTNGNFIRFRHDHLKDNTTINVVVKKFSSGREISTLDLNIEDKIDYFNYTVLNDPGRLTLEDLTVLKEIQKLALGLYNEKTIY